MTQYWSIWPVPETAGGADCVNIGPQVCQSTRRGPTGQLQWDKEAYQWTTATDNAGWDTVERMLMKGDYSHRDLACNRMFFFVLWRPASAHLLTRGESRVYTRDWLQVRTHTPPTQMMSHQRARLISQHCIAVSHFESACPELLSWCKVLRGS